MSGTTDPPIVIGADDARVVGTGLLFPEGPIALDDGTVLVAEIEGGSLARVDLATGERSVVADCGGGPNGAALGPDGAVYVANDGGMRFETHDGMRGPVALAPDNPGGSVQRVDVDTGTVETVATDSDGARIGALNDIVFDAAGGYYLVDTTSGRLHYGDPATGALRVALDDLAVPNGMGLSPDGERLYVSGTFSGDVEVLDVAGPGDLRGRRTLYRSEGRHGADGLAVDGAGNVCLADLGRHGILVIGADGTVRGQFTTPRYDRYVTNICFGGPDGDTAYVCSAGLGLLYALRWPWPGLRLNYAR